MYGRWCGNSSLTFSTSLAWASITFSSIQRTLGSLDELAEAVDESLADADFVTECDPETLEFLTFLRAQIVTARRERLPIVASW